LHCLGIGNKTENKLKAVGFNTWEDCFNNQTCIPLKGQKLTNFLENLALSKEKLDKNDIRYFVDNLPTKEHWRILAKYFDEATFFDIETTGLRWSESQITVITAFKDYKLHSFVYQDNLDDFLNLVDESKLLVSFNGNSFDIPFVERSFNIPYINCPYIDLRWIAYHRGYRCGLKDIEKTMNIGRPSELADVDGYEAILLFYRWQSGEEDAKYKLIKYCQADTLCTCLVASRILKEYNIIKEIFKDDILDLLK